MGCNMGKAEKILPWWDQESDRAGRPIRTDVRSAAQEVWTEACRRTEALLADRWQAADLMEESVAQVSRYLDRIEAPQSCPKNGLLLLAFSRLLRRRAVKSRRLEFAGGAVDLSNLLVDSGWSRQMDARLELEKIVRNLSEMNGMVLTLRHAGYNWEEVSERLGTSVTGIRNSFWREVKDLRKKLRNDNDMEKRCHGQPSALVKTTATRDSTLNAMGAGNVMMDVLPVTTLKEQVRKRIRTRTSKLPRLRRRLSQRSSEI